MCIHVHMYECIYTRMYVNITDLYLNSHRILQIIVHTFQRCGNHLHTYVHKILYLILISCNCHAIINSLTSSYLQIWLH